MDIQIVNEWPTAPTASTLYLKGSPPNRFEIGYRGASGSLKFLEPVTKLVPDKKKLLVYYGYPIAYKGLWDANAVINEIAANFNIWVVGDTYQDPLHEEYASTRAIIAGVQAAGVKVYGYVPIGQNTQGLTVVQIKAKIDDWVDCSVDGIFLDEFGFDYENTRSKQIEIVNYVHAQSLPYCANAWTYADVSIDSLANIPWPSNDWRYTNFSTYNPTNLVLPRNPGDSYLVENFCFDHQGPTNKWDAQERFADVKAAMAAVNMEVWALAVFGETAPGTLDTSLLGAFDNLDDVGAYISANAYLYDIPVVGSGGYSFGSNGTPLWAPVFSLEGAEIPVADADNNYTTSTFTRSFGDVVVTVVNESETVMSLTVEKPAAVGKVLSGTYPPVPVVSPYVTTAHFDAVIGDIQAALEAINGG